MLIEVYRCSKCKALIDVAPGYRKYTYPAHYMREMSECRLTGHRWEPFGVKRKREK